MGFFSRKPGTDLTVRTHQDLEQRAPTAATTPVRYTTTGRAQLPDWDAAQAFRIANNTVLTCIDRVASYLSRCPFRVGADPEKPDDFDVNAPLARLLGPPPGGPNPATSARRLWAWTIGQRMLAGRYAWEIELNGETPVALWPLPVSSLLPIPSQSGTTYFTAYEYGRPAERKRLPPERVLYDWLPAADDWRQPDPPLRRAYLDTMIAIMQTSYDYAFLKNDARPAAIIVTEEFADEDDLRAFEQQWNHTYGGPQNAGRVAVVEADASGSGVQGAIDVKVLGISPKDAQAAQRYEYRLTQIAVAMGVPWSILDASGRTYDNASQEWQNFVRGTLEPLAHDLADAINMQLAPRLGSLVGWFDLTTLGATARAHTVTAPTHAPAMVQAQLMMIDEARADYGLPPLPDGTGNRLMSATEIVALHTNIGASGTIDTQRGMAPEVREVSPAPAAAPAPGPDPPALPEDRGETAEEVEARRTKIWNASAAIVRALEQAFEQDMVRLFKRQERSTLARLEHKRARRASEVRELADEVFDPDHWVQETEDEVRRLYRNITATAGGVMADRFALDFNLDAPYVQDFIRSRANQLAGNVTDTTYSAIQDALTEGVGAGESIPDLAARIQHVFDVATQSRATTIARTETISAYNGAGTEVAQNEGEDVVAGQEWLATRDNRTREQHAERDGEIVAVGEAFSGGLMYPGDPAGDPADTVNCRCTIVYLTPEEFAQRSARSIPLPVARAVLALVHLGPFDDRAVRSALRLAS